MKYLLIVVTTYFLSFATMASEAVEYRTELTFSPKSSALHAVTEMQIPKKYRNSDTVTLFLNKDFSVESVEGQHIESFEVKPSKKVPIWNEVIIEFSSLTKSNNKTVRIKYAGSIDNNAQHGNFITSNQAHLSIDSAWHPVFSDFSTPITGTVTVELNDDWEVFGPGQVTNSGNKYQVISTAPTIDVSLYAERNPTIIYNDGFTVVHDESNADKAEFVSDVGLQCFEQMNQRFGKQKQLKAAQTILLERPGPSFARGNYISLNSQTLGSKVHTHQYLCHEIAHNWTNFTSAMSHDYWMIESFAEYISAKEVARIYGGEEFQNILKKWQARAKGEAFVWRRDTARRASHKVNYGLGPIALMKLQEKLGEADFNELIDWYMTNDVTETEALITQVGTLAGADTENWFSALLAGNNSE
ncbi:hypothetical protein [Idiomarina abyssalis]|uniref:hypothetical protein n=1 Tax=Idiomarina abyssalis TaxID=86102 RepID=UPI003A903668